MANNLSVKGKLAHKFDSQAVTDTFTKREFVLTVGDRYPQPIKFQLSQDKCQLIDAYNVGQELTVHFDLRGREWQGKYFVDLNAWKIEGQAAPAVAHIVPPQATVQTPEDDDDELPF